MLPVSTAPASMLHAHPWPGCCEQSEAVVDSMLDLLSPDSMPPSVARAMVAVIGEEESGLSRAERLERRLRAFLGQLEGAVQLSEDYAEKLMDAESNLRYQQQELYQLRALMESETTVQEGDAGSVGGARAKGGTFMSPIELAGSAAEKGATAPSPGLRSGSRGSFAHEATASPASAVAGGAPDTAMSSGWSVPHGSASVISHRSNYSQSRHVNDEKVCALACVDALGGLFSCHVQHSVCVVAFLQCTCGVWA